MSILVIEPTEDNAEQYKIIKIENNIATVEDKDGNIIKIDLNK